jgi:hypothetical protein
MKKEETEWTQTAKEKYEICTQNLVRKPEKEKPQGETKVRMDKSYYT